MEHVSQFLQGGGSRSSEFGQFGSWLFGPLSRSLAHGLPGIMTSYSIDPVHLNKTLGVQENGSLLPRDSNGKYLYSDVDFIETWRGMEHCVRLGLVRSIGVSNFNSSQLQRILDRCSIKPVVNQIECHPYLNNAQLIRFCRERDIAVTAYSPLGSAERPWAKPGEPVLLRDEQLKNLSIKYRRSVAQIVLRYQVI